MTILDLVARNAQFQPSSVEDYTALQIARRLQDSRNVCWYARLVSRLGMDKCLDLYWRSDPLESGASERFRKSAHH